MKKLSAVALMLVMTAGEAVAQVDPGARVRVRSADGSKLQGVLKAIDDGTLTLELDGQAGTRQISRASLRRIDQSRGMKRNGGRGAVVGALTGFVLGFLAGEDCSGRSSDRELWFNWDNFYICFDRGEMALGGGVLGAASGALLGVAIKTERWQPARLEPPANRARGIQIVPVISRGGVGAVAAVRFGSVRR